MRKKKTSHALNDLPSQTMSPGTNLDPVNNDQLHHDVWTQLTDRLKGTNKGIAL
jgi:hypothetical protein